MRRRMRLTFCLAILVSVLGFGNSGFAVDFNGYQGGKVRKTGPPSKD